MNLKSRSFALQFIETIDSTWKGHEQFVIWLVKRLQPKIVVDLGFDRGLSTLAFAYKNRGHVFGIDWFFEEGSYAEKSYALDTAFRNITEALKRNYVKNIHLIIGPYRDVLKNWHQPIDIFHIDWVHTYRAVKFQYDSWRPHLKEDAILLIHDVLAYPDEVGKFFTQLPDPKCVLKDGKGLGVASSNRDLIEEIRQHWCVR
jgi:predicted O-methyltransferase YrrM